MTEVHASMDTLSLLGTHFTTGVRNFSSIVLGVLDLFAKASVLSGNLFEALATSSRASPLTIGLLVTPGPFLDTVDMKDLEAI